MKIIKNALKENKVYQEKEDISFPSNLFNDDHLRNIKKCHVEYTYTLYEDFLDVIVDIDTVVVTTCAYSLEEVDLPLHIHDDLLFSEEENDEDAYYEKGNIIDLDEYIFGLIVANTPLKVIKKGSHLPEDGEGYRVLSEDEFKKERENRKDERWSVLDNLDLED